MSGATIVVAMIGEDGKPKWFTKLENADVELGIEEDYYDMSSADGTILTRFVSSTNTRIVIEGRQVVES